MPKFNDPTNPSKVGGTAKVKTQAGGVPLIVEKRCKVCQSPHRHVIDQMLVAGLTFSAIERNFEFANIPRRSIASHKEKHLGYEEAGLREIIEREATLAQRNYDEGVARVVTKNAYLEVALQKAYDALIKDLTVVEPKDAVKVIEMLQKLQEQNQAVALDELRMQLQMFIQAVKEVVEKDRWELIVDRTEQLLKGKQSPVLAPAVDATVAEAEVVV